MSNFTIIPNRASTSPSHPAPSPLRKSLSRRQRPARDERGITLQTLIVTAVLVLVAVGAGVILVAISRNSESNLEASGNSDLELTCEPWEINLISLEAKRSGGPQGYGGIFSSAVGCVRVCYVQPRWGGQSRAATTYRIIPSGEAAGGGGGSWELVLGFSLSDIRVATSSTAASTDFSIYQVVSSTEVGNIPPRTADAATRNAVRTLDAAEQMPLLTVVDENQEIRVHKSQEFCHVVDTANDDEEIARSDFDYGTSVSGLNRPPGSFAYP